MAKRAGENINDYICKILDEMPKDMSGTAPTPASNNLLDITNDNPKKLDKATANMFNHNVTKLLFLSKMARHNIQTSVAFLHSH
jgi:hypothetical protein